jgi:hypothetical protein
MAGGEGLVVAGFPFEGFLQMRDVLYGPKQGLFVLAVGRKSHFTKVFEHGISSRRWHAIRLWFSVRFAAR